MANNQGQLPAVGNGQQLGLSQFATTHVIPLPPFFPQFPHPFNGQLPGSVTIATIWDLLSVQLSSGDPIITIASDVCHAFDQSDVNYILSAYL